MADPQRIFFSFLILLILQCANFSLTQSKAITAASKEQIACTMCSACENPCQPVPSPPPPSPPPPAATSNCPPPPSPPSSSGGTYYYSPPPPSQPTYVYSSPPPPAGGAFYPPPDSGNYPTGNYVAPPPPNPILPYFPFYYYNSPASPNSAHPKLQFSIVSTISLLLLTLCFF